MLIELSEAESQFLPSQDQIHKQAEFALAFYLQYEPRVAKEHGLGVAARFAAWWKSTSTLISPWASNQREFNISAFEAVEDWLDRKVRVPRLKREASVAHAAVEKTEEEKRRQQEKRRCQTNSAGVGRHSPRV